MIQTLIKNWWLLALCGVLDAIISIVYFDHAGHGFHSSKDILFLGRVSVAAGICAIAAAMWRSDKGKCWLLALNGLALGALGLIFNGIAGSRISFRTVALLILLMAISIGLLEMLTARTMRHRRQGVDGWFLGSAGAASVCFVVPFFALGFGWIRIQPGSFLDLLWLGSFFAFSAICMMALALRLHFQSGQTGGLLPLGNPRHAH
ncbi:MAG: hypothetical protein WAM39_02515 [Bryobacteraceae bacterium]